MDSGRQERKKGVDGGTSDQTCPSSRALAVEHEYPFSGFS